MVLTPVVVAFVVGAVATGVVGYFRDKGFRANVNKDIDALHIEVLNVRAKLAGGLAVVENDWNKAVSLFESLAGKL